MTNIADIAAQNDDFRKHLSKGTLVLTRGIRSNTSEDIKEIITKVRTFDKFDENNDPYNEHETSLSVAREERPMQHLVVRASRKLVSVAAQFGAFDYKGKRFSGKLTTMTESFFIFHQM